MTRPCFFSFVGILLVGCGAGRELSDSRKPKLEATHADAQSAPILGEFLVDEPVVHRNLAVFPVISVVPRNEDQFITLDEGLRAGTVEILEMGAAGQVTRRAATSTPSDGGPPIQPSPNAVERANHEAVDEVHRPVQEQPLGSSSAPNGEPCEGGDHDHSLQQALDCEDACCGQNDVNRVLVLNRSDRPLYLMPGEIIVGGDQDRAIGRELVIQPSDEPVAIDVFCVEHGRWGGRGAESAELLEDARSFEANLSFAAAETQSVEEAADAADKGKFVASAGSLNRPARLAVQGTKDQSQVWDKVAEENRKANVQTSSGAFTGQYVQKDAVRRLQPYVTALHEPISELEHVVGVIVAVNGKIESMDIFASTPLFNKLWPKLLKSYAVDAANAFASFKVKQECPLCSRQDASRFLADAVEAQIEDATVERGIALTTRSTDRLVTYSAEDACSCCCCSSCCGDGAGGGGFGGAIHTSGFAR